MIAIVDYGLGNVRAFANVFAALDVQCSIATRPEQLQGAAKVVLPGVGAFDQAMQRLRASGMRPVLDEMALERAVPVLGVCVGMQILAASSAEGGEPGLGWIDGHVEKFPETDAARRIWVPHMGWNGVRALRAGRLFDGLDADSRFYFLHSYYMRCRSPDDALAVTDYGGEFVCAVARRNVFGVQFHPEKSHAAGVRLLKNFAEM
jgi:glutamine amidotransferase